MTVILEIVYGEKLFFFCNVFQCAVFKYLKSVLLFLGKVIWLDMNDWSIISKNFLML